jgi:hypothetical protein
MSYLTLITHRNEKAAIEDFIKTIRIRDNN